METITMSNVRYITGTSKKVEKKLVSQKMIVFAETKGMLKTIVDLMIKDGLKPASDKIVEHKSPVYHGWEIHKTPFSQTFETKTRQIFQPIFKKAKKSAMTASKAALALAMSAKKVTDEVKPKVEAKKPAVAKTDSKKPAAAAKVKK